jgi:hypothetical protein
MSNDAKKTSQLDITTTLSNNDRVVVLRTSGTLATQTITANNLAIGLANVFPIASSISAGVIKVGNNLTINATGYLNAVNVAASSANNALYLGGTEAASYQLKILDTNNVEVNSAEGVDNTNYQSNATLLSLTTQVQKLGTDGLDQDHHYYLPNGTEGQIMYFTTNGTGASSHLLVWMDNMRLFDGTVITNSYWLWNGGGWDRSTAFTIFTDGAWNIDGGFWGPL